MHITSWLNWVRFDSWSFIWSHYSNQSYKKNSIRTQPKLCVLFTSSFSILNSRDSVMVWILRQWLSQTLLNFENYLCCMLRRKKKIHLSAFEIEQSTIYETDQFVHPKEIKFCENSTVLPIVNASTKCMSKPFNSAFSKRVFVFERLYSYYKFI